MVATAIDSAFRQQLIDAGLLQEIGAQGLYARSRVFEDVVEGLQANVRAGFGDPAPVQLMLPWVVPSRLVTQTDYIRSFPDLTGVVFGFAGDDRAHARLLAAVEEGGVGEGVEWTGHLTATDTALCSAGCHPIYPLYAGAVLTEPLRVDAVGHCFRNEPSAEPGRMRTFRQHEQVCVGSDVDAEAHRLAWLTRAQEFFSRLQLDVIREEANDPFFGRLGRVLASGQRAQGLKEELVADIGGRPTAIASGNNHQDHFAVPFDITLADGSRAQSSCIGFGLERVTLALFSKHGLDVGSWPSAVTALLRP